MELPLWANARPRALSAWANRAHAKLTKHEHSRRFCPPYEPCIKLFGINYSLQVSHYHFRVK
jgi:hypothetical protein